MIKRKHKPADKARLKHHELVPKPCSKVPYPSKAAAKRTARQLQSRQGRDPNAPYRCDECGQWHLTSQHRDARKKVLDRVRKSGGVAAVDFGDES